MVNSVRRSTGDSTASKLSTCAVRPPRADLARLRRALGKPAGSVPEVWAYTVGAVPESLRWDRDEPSRAEQAAHAALTLFAMHQQSMPVPAHMHGVSLGRAVGQLAAGGEQSADAVTRRFMAVATATSVDEALELRSTGRFNCARSSHSVVRSTICSSSARR